MHFRHPFWLFLLERMRKSDFKEDGVERIGGSIFLSNAFDDWESERKRNSLLIDFIGPGRLNTINQANLISNGLSL